MTGTPSSVVEAPPEMHLRGVNFNIFSQSTFTSGQPNKTVDPKNYQPHDKRTLDYLVSKGINHVRMMFTWEWLQDTLSAPIPDTADAARLAYWHDFVAAVNAFTDASVYVMIEPYGFSSTANDTRPVWKDQLVGGTTVTNTHYANLNTQLGAHFKDNPYVLFGLVNEPNDMSTMSWFSAAQTAITALRDAGYRNHIFVPGNGYSTWNWTSTDATYDTAATKRNSAYGWENANGVGQPLSDPLNLLVASPHIYLDDMGGKMPNITAIDGGTQTTAIVDRIKVVVDWVRAFNATHPGRNDKVYLGEIGYYAGTTTPSVSDWEDNKPAVGNYTAVQAQHTWNTFIDYLDTNRDVLLGFAWWAASELNWWMDTKCMRFSVSPQLWGASAYTGDTINMNMIESTFVPKDGILPNASGPGFDDNSGTMSTFRRARSGG